jgi:hypothetical protein
MSASTEHGWMCRTAGTCLELAQRMHAIGDTETALEQTERARELLLAIKLAEERAAMRREMAESDLEALRRNGL